MHRLLSRASTSLLLSQVAISFTFLGLPVYAQANASIGENKATVGVWTSNSTATVGGGGCLRTPSGLWYEEEKTSLSATESSGACATIQLGQALSEHSSHDSNESKSSPAAPVNVLQGRAQEVENLVQPTSTLVFIDNDQVPDAKVELDYKELPTDEGKTKIIVGGQFPVVMSSSVTSKTATSGDPVEARLKYDLKIGDRLIAKQGAVVNGHVKYSLKARSSMSSVFSKERRYHNSGFIGLTFEEIINEKGEHIPLVATPAKEARIVKNKAEGRELGVNQNGEVTGPFSQQIRYTAIHIGLSAAMAPAGVFSFGAMPVALGVIGAANPSFAFMKPIGQNVNHRRIKGFVWGALGGLPGGWAVEGAIIKGQEAVLKPGDELLAEFKEEFTGEPQSEAELIARASTKVKGQVLPAKRGKT